MSRPGRHLGFGLCLLLQFPAISLEMASLAAMLATHALGLSWACGGGGAAFHIFQMLPQSALREAPPAMRADRIPRILPRRHVLAAKND